MLFSGKENVFMCLVVFQKMFRKIFSDVWLCSWKYHRKHIFYLLLTFSRLPNDYIISFIPQNTNKTQKKSIGEIAISARSWSEQSAIAINTFARCVDRDRAKIEAEIAIAIAIGATAPAGDVGGAMRRSRSLEDRSGDRNHDRRYRASRWCLSLSLSLSLSLFSKARSTLKGK